MVGNIFRAFLIIVASVGLPFIINRNREVKRIPIEISMFSFGYGSCVFIDFLWADQAHIILYPYYPQALLQVPCSVVLLVLATIQMLLYSTLCWTKIFNGMSSQNILERIFYIFLSVFLAIFSLCILLTPEILWR